MQTGQMIFTSTEQVVFGKPAAESVLEIAEAQDAKNVFILASHFLRNNTEEIANIEKALGSRHAATWSGIPPHAPRKSVIEATRAARKHA